MAHFSKNGTFLHKWHIYPTWHTHPKMAHSSKNGTFIQNWHIPPKLAHSSKNGTFIQKWHIHPKMTHSSKNGTILLKWHIPPKMAHSSKKAHSSKNGTYLHFITEEKNKWFCKKVCNKMEFDFQSNYVMNSVKYPYVKSLSHCLTELFPIYQNNIWTIRQWDNHTIVLYRRLSDFTCPLPKYSKWVLYTYLPYIWKSFWISFDLHLEKNGYWWKPLPKML